MFCADDLSYSVTLRSHNLLPAWYTSRSLLSVPDGTRGPMSQGFDKYSIENTDYKVGQDNVEK
jgi:hypothetical protein